MVSLRPSRILTFFACLGICVNFLAGHALADDPKSPQTPAEQEAPKDSFPVATVKASTKTLAVLSIFSASSAVQHRLEKYYRSGKSEDYVALTKEIAEIIAKSGGQTVDSSAVWLQILGSRVAHIGGDLPLGRVAGLEGVAGRIASMLISYRSFLGWEVAAQWHLVTLRRLKREAKDKKDILRTARVERMESNLELLKDPGLMADFVEEMVKSLTLDQGLYNTIGKGAQRWASFKIFSLYGAITWAGGGAKWLTEKAVLRFFGPAIAGARTGRLAGWFGALAGSVVGLMARDQPAVAEAMQDMDSWMMTQPHILFSQDWEKALLQAVEQGPKNGPIYIWSEYLDLLARDPGALHKVECRMVGEAGSLRVLALVTEIEDLLAQLEPRYKMTQEYLENSGDLSQVDRLLGKDAYVMGQLEDSLDTILEAEGYQALADVEKRSWGHRRANLLQRDPSLMAALELSERSVDSLTPQDVKDYYGYFKEIQQKNLRYLGLETERSLIHDDGSFETLSIQEFLSLPDREWSESLSTYSNLTLQKDLIDWAKPRLSRQQKLNAIFSAAKLRKGHLDGAKSPGLVHLRKVREIIHARATKIRTALLESASATASCMARVALRGKGCSQDDQSLVNETERQLDNIYRMAGIMDRVLDWNGVGESAKKDEQILEGLDFLRMVTQLSPQTDREFIDVYRHQQEALAQEKIREILAEQGYWVKRNGMDNPYEKGLEKAALEVLGRNIQSEMDSVIPVWTNESR